MKVVSLFKILQFIIQDGAEETLKKIEIASHDPLTGLCNRRALDKKRVGEYTIVFIDIDNFKEINDSSGYQKGDEILRSFGNILKPLSRKEDVFVRWGGDEFLLILPETKTEGAEILLERVKRKGEELSLPITFSFGIVESNGEDFSCLLKQASERMKVAKKSSKRAVL